MKTSIAIFIFIVFIGSISIRADEFEQCEYHSQPEQYDRCVLEQIRKGMKQKLGRKLEQMSEMEKTRLMEEHINLLVQRSLALKRSKEFRNNPLKFYGMVVDESGNPIVNADVSGYVEQEKMIGNLFVFQQTVRHHFSLSTGEQGRFAVYDKTGWRVVVENIRVRGYRFVADLQPGQTFYPVSHPSQLKVDYSFQQTPKFPKVFILKASD